MNDELMKNNEEISTVTELIKRNFVLGKEIESLKEQNKKMRECLEFYADERNYSRWGYMKIGGDDYFDCDKKYLGNDGHKDSWDIRGGKRARELLKQLKEEEI
jgi:cell shape-determining protein MreC